jgi:hypothetical protein
MKELHYTINEGKLKSMGYTFQKLYAANYKSYRKEIGHTKVWLWSKGKTIEINDWHQHTANIIEFYKENLEAHKERESLMPKPSDYMVLRVKEDDSSVIFKDKIEYYNVIGKSDAEQDAYFNKYENYREVVIYMPNFQDILDEIEILTK